MSNIEDEPPPVLLPCTVCSRTFSPEVLDRHIKVCEKTSSKKRRVFDSFKSRVSGTELEEFLGPAPLPGQAPRRPCKSPVKKRQPSKWKETHENLIATLRAARGVELPDIMTEAPKPAGNEKCPSCSRYFGPRAFDRHVEFCKEKTSRIKLTPSKVSQAQERLEARTKYRAPLSVKPKLTTKEKYSPMLNRKESTESCSVSSAKTSPPIPTLNRNLKPGKQNSSGFSRQSPIRCSERQRSVSPLKKPVVSCSSPRSSAKSEAQAKQTNQPKIKQNLKSPEDLRPKTGTKASTQEKIRSSNLKLSQLEDETCKQLKTAKRKTREKTAPKTSLPSYNESLESSENSDKQDAQAQNKMTSRNGQKSGLKKKLPKEAEMALDLCTIEKSQTKTKDEMRSGRKSKQQKIQINDLSVNDESFGIFVAACTVQPPSSSASRTSLKTVKGSPKKKNAKTKAEEREPSERVEKKTKQHLVRSTTPQEIETSPENKEPEYFTKATENARISKVEKNSKIPKPKSDFSSKKVDKTSTAETVPETFSVDFKVTPKNEDISREEKIKRKSNQWRNITEMPTEELNHLSEEFDFPMDDVCQELSESAIWEIAAEQFLNSEEPNQSTSAFSVDSLSESGNKKNLESEVACEKSSPHEDDLIVLHVTDPAKLIENDADMKLSVSEPCFPRSSTVQKLKKRTPDRKKIDVVVFTASPSAVQSKATHRRRRKSRKTKKLSPPELSHIREKTFLANDLPKPKRRKMSNQNTWTYRLTDFGDYHFNTPSKEEVEEKKNKFIETLKSQKEKIRKWQITANSHIRYMEEVQKSIEDDLEELKNLSKGKKTRRRSGLKDFKREKLRKMKENQEKMKPFEKEPKTEFKCKSKKFEYFEISLSDEVNSNEEESCGSKKKKKECLDEKAGVVRSPEKILRPGIVTANSEGSSMESCNFPPKTKKFECFEISNCSMSKQNRRKEKTTEQNVQTNEKRSEERRGKSSPRTVKVAAGERLTSESVISNSTKVMSHQNSSLENIEEVDENVDDEKAIHISHFDKKNIEIEDFILSKPNAQKIFSKEDNCLDGLFPKPRKAAEVVIAADSTTAVQLDFSADSVYDLKSKEEKKLKVLPQISARNNSTRMLQKRMKKESQLPQILVKSGEQKENSMISLIEMWKNKKGTSESEKIYKAKATLPTGKLPPLTNKNSFQIAALPNILKKKLSEMVKKRLLDGTDSNDSYDPFKQAERQMLALLSWPSTADIKTAKNLSPSPKSKSSPQQGLHLETSPTSAFTKYPTNKDEQFALNDKMSARRNLNETFEVNEIAKKNSLNEKPTYSAADDWEQIFEKHFDLNRNEMTEQMTRTVKTALDGLLKSTIKNKSNLTEEEFSPQKSKNELMQDSVITEVLYTSTPKQNSKIGKGSKPRSKDSVSDLDQTPNTYRKHSNFSYGVITPPDDFSDSLGKAKRNDKTNRNSGISLSSLSFCSQISDTTLADEEVMRSNLEIIGKAAAAAAARTPRRKYARSQSVFDERNKMLFAKTYDPNCSSSDENDVEVLPNIVDKQGKKSPSRNPNPKPYPSHFYRSHSVMESRCKGDGDHSEEGDHVSSSESNRNRKAKLSGDSAYSSLNRRSPRQNTQRNQQEDRLSSSGSEHSLTTVNDYDLKPKSLDFDDSPPAKKDQPVKMSKFCHECGSKYPVAVAKFCCECGVRRLII